MRLSLFFFLFFGASFLTGCQSHTQEKTATVQQQSAHKNHHRRHHNQPYLQRDSGLSTTGYQPGSRSANVAGAKQQATQIPKKVYDVLAYVRANGRAMDGYVGGRRFGNFENHLARSSPDGKLINYQEWDVNQKIAGKNRGVERLITGSDGRAWYTNDHYNTFTEVK